MTTIGDFHHSYGKSPKKGALNSESLKSWVREKEIRKLPVYITHAQTGLVSLASRPQQLQRRTQHLEQFLQGDSNTTLAPGNCTHQLSINIFYIKKESRKSKIEKITHCVLFTKQSLTIDPWKLTMKFLWGKSPSSLNSFLSSSILSWAEFKASMLLSKSFTLWPWYAISPASNGCTNEQLW